MVLCDRNTREVFGDYIDVYDMTQAVEDGATRPVYYESRVIHLKLDQNTLQLIDSTYDLLEQIHCPVLVLGGRQDKIVGGQASEELAEQLGCDIYMYEQFGHGVYEEARDFNKRMYDFLQKLICVVLPRIRDFRGISAKSFDGRGNYTLGLKEQALFPEITYEEVDLVKGMNVSVITTANTDDEARELLRLLGMPFKK